MTSGHKLTERQVRDILRLASYETTDGGWLLTLEAIAHQLDLHPATISEHLRQAAVAWGKHTQWRSETPEEP